ncbi:hypothetical protein [Glaciibacter psychrotolerans]|uniref:Uncharacterized protein n=1 Tax=Glaciibacter psychrotolerans TaxID=670054 RepID=A0A7Z0J4S6_9MICO|nr:hypothetical protein [Leifsonia psychrotolerans]NYJ18650.1 hypothetical protein [Leifsonia psychrotolerans]
MIGAFLAPVAVVASWAKIELTDTDRFVASYAPLADEPAVQRFVTDQTVAVINQHLDVPQLTAEVIDGITSLGTGPVATRALDAMKGPAAAGIQSLIRSGVSTFIASDAFAAVWRDALRISHSQLIAAMRNDPHAAVQIAGDGSIGIQLSPVIAAVKKALVAQGIGFASQIPEVNRTIVIAQSDAVPTIQLVYGVAVGAGAWLPWVSLLFLLAGILVARRKVRALIGAASALALAMAITLAALFIGDGVFIASVSPTVLPSDVAGLAYSTVVEIIQTLGLAIFVLALAVAVVAWFAGPFRTPRRLRTFFTSGARITREAAERQGISTGRTGEWLYRQRVLLRVVVAVAAAVAILFLRPLTAGVIIWTLIIAVLVVAILELLQRPVIEVPRDSDAETPVSVV